MPTYEYKCKKCDHQFELWQEVGAEAPQCPECGAEVQKVFHPIRTIYKGSGFYITDSRPAAPKPEATDSKSSQPESSSDAKTPKASGESKEKSAPPQKTSAAKVS
jgi:putative FmdB family regulatory protein